MPAFLQLSIGATRRRSTLPLLCTTPVVDALGAHICDTSCQYLPTICIPSAAQLVNTVVSRDSCPQNNESATRSHTPWTHKGSLVCYSQSSSFYCLFPQQNCSRGETRVLHAATPVERVLFCQLPLAHTFRQLEIFCRRRSQNISRSVSIYCTWHLCQTSPTWSSSVL